MTRKIMVLLMLVILAATTVSAARIATSQLGFHPQQDKQFIVYDDATGGSFELLQGSTIVYSGTLDPATCQGSQICATGDFSDFTSEGTYTIRAEGTTGQITINSDIFSTLTDLSKEFFMALKQQGSPYHADFHGIEDPQFTIMADGSFIQTTDQATKTTVRLSNAYQRNPQVFAHDEYTILQTSTPDMAEFIKLHVDYLASLQDHDGSPAMPGGWFYDFSCPADYNPYEERYTTTQDPCLFWQGDGTPLDEAKALLAYTLSVPVIHTHWGEAQASTLLERAITTEEHLQSQALGADASAYRGAALFQIYDYTGDLAYLQRAHALRAQVSKTLNSETTDGNEFYWEEYVRHREDIESNAMEYLLSGEDPAAYFQRKIDEDWAGVRTNHAIQETAERVYIRDIDQNFQHGRSILIEAILAAKSMELTSTQPHTKTVMDSQLSFLTGTNSVQQGTGAGDTRSYSFIFGIGDNPTNQHVRIVSSNFFTNGNVFPNGASHIPGWVVGPLESAGDGDMIFNYADNWHQWRYTESTNEIVAASAELAAYMDGQYNGENRLLRPLLADQDPPEDPPEEPDSPTSIDIIEEYSAEHNIVMHCNVDVPNATTYSWTVDGEVVFESNKQDYGPATQTFPNYLHTFPGNGTYDVTCTGQNTAGSHQTATRTIPVETRATPEEIAEQMTVVRLGTEYLGNYGVRYTCDVIGQPSPFAWFETNGHHFVQEGEPLFETPEFTPDTLSFAHDNKTMSVKYFKTERFLEDPIGGIDHFGGTETVPSWGDYQVECRGGTSIEEAWKPHQNAGALKGFSCAGGARGGSPECNPGSDFASFSIDEEQIPSGTTLRAINETHHQVVCNVPGSEGHIVQIEGLGLQGADKFPDAGTPVNFTIDPEVVNQEENGVNVLCRHDTGGTSQAFGGQATFWQSLRIPQFEESTPAGPGSMSTLRIAGGSLNEQPLDNDEMVINVEPGEVIAGNVLLEWSSAWEREINQPLGYTPTWEDHETSYETLSLVSGNGSEIQFVSLTAPSESGTYHIIFAYREGADTADVFSMTQTDPDIWDDGNDIAGWTLSQIADAQAHGRTIGKILSGNSLSSVFVPAAAITVHVDESNETPGQCTERLSSLAATCNGGIITSDESSGSCRGVSCEGAQGSIDILACEKPDDADTPIYFEMYRQSQTGTPPEICLGDDCISTLGFVRGSDFPICTEEPSETVCGNGILETGEQCDDGNTANNDGCSSTCQLENQEPADQDPVCGNGILETGEQCDDANTNNGDGCSTTCTQESACFSSITEIPTTCTGGTITHDTFNGCRTIVCGGLQVLACDKPDGSNPQFFEMYKQSSADGVEICLAETCIAGNGFAQSTAYPICLEDPTTPVCGNGILETGEQCDDANTNNGDGCSTTCTQEQETEPVCGNGILENTEQCDDGNTANNDGCSSTCQLESTNSEVEIRIADWYPQGLNAVLICDSPETESYAWDFGDGHSQVTATDNVYHTYPQPGTYTTTCTTSIGMDTLSVTVS